MGGCQNYGPFLGTPNVLGAVLYSDPKRESF